MLQHQQQRINNYVNGRDHDVLGRLDYKKGDKYYDDTESDEDEDIALINSGKDYFFTTFINK